MRTKEYHVPVMLQQCLDGLNIQANGTYIDATFGGGGHARAIFDQLNSEGNLIVFDQDADAKNNTWDADNFHFVEANFSFLQNHLKLMGTSKVDGILADLGVSSHQFDEKERGFSIRTNAKLDMRMNQQVALSAFQVVNSYEEEQLTQLFRNYGELKHAKRIAQEILIARSKNAIATTFDLMDALQSIAPKFKENKFFAQVFQAIRIEVNQEMEALRKFLEQSANALSPNGRLVVMSYHSLEDRMVKNFMKRGSISGTIEKDFYGNVLKSLDEVVRKPIVASDEECENNPRARSAKLRIAKRRDG